ncbi:MAG: cryptochrome/photolyase family protein [Salinispira sp.]
MVLYWFRQDLRLHDNPALSEALRRGRVLPLYILDDINAGNWKPGAASRWWLHHSLISLNSSLEGCLMFRRGNPADILTELVGAYRISSVFWNRCYEPWQIQRDKTVKKTLREMGVEVRSFNASLLWEPWEILKTDGRAFRVFSAFYRAACLHPPRKIIPAVVPSAEDNFFRDSSGAGNSIASLELLPSSPHWYKKLEPHWNVGESAALLRLEEFLKDGLAHYAEGRDLPAKPFVSRLSPHIHFGEISPQQIWEKISEYPPDKNTAHFCSELGWREFSFNLLYYNPELPHKNLRKEFNEFPWEENPEALRRWQEGNTGIPMVDAGMRELWQTGYMHNRARMICASFLVKNLLLHWRDGEQWFWDCLVDADLAGNSAGWQWVAGCGADAAPYFRIFNPVLQGKKFDSNGEYIRRYIPELSELPNRYVFSPWEAPPEILRAANVTLGNNYPKAIVNLADSRRRALDAYSGTRSRLN